MSLVFLRSGRSGFVVLSLFAALAAFPGVSAPAYAQQDSNADISASPTLYSSTYLPLGHWAYDYINTLIARGRLKDLPPLVQPYRRLDIARAIISAEDSGELSDLELQWLELVAHELDHEMSLAVGDREQTVKFSADVGAGLKGLSHTHRDLLRPDGDESVFAVTDLYLYGEAPMVAGVVGGSWDNHYLNDPQFPNGRAVERRQCDPFIDECGYRVEEAYVELQLPYARLFFGRMYRNWGLADRHGLLVSNYAYSYDHVSYRFGGPRIALSGLFAPFNDFTGDTARYFSSHRLDWQIRDNLAVSFGESVVYGGENRRVDFNLTNPVGVWEISGSSRGRERNALGLGEVWWRPIPQLLAYGAFMVDNTSVGDEGKSEGFTQYAAAFSVQLPQVMPALALRGDLRIVSALAYRSRVAFYEYYWIDKLGLAQDLTDAITVSLGATWFARPGLALKPRLQLLWSGEDDLRDAFPEGAFFGRDLLLVGVIERTIRPSLGGRWALSRGDLPWDLRLEVDWDLGVNFVKNEGNQVSDWDAKGVGRVVLRARRLFQ